MERDEIERCSRDPDYLLKKYFQNQRFCMSFDKDNCSGNIIQSHIISVMFLRNLERNNHVYIPEYSSHHETALIELKLKGINKALRASAFCSFHDKALFASFEDNSFQSTYRQIFDISFRALCREYYQKKCLLTFQNSMKEGKLSEIDQAGFTENELFSSYQSHAIDEIRDHKFLYEQFKKYKYCGLKYLVIRMSKIPISATGILFPLFDSKGNRIQRENGRQLGFVYNLVSSKEYSFLILSTVMNLHNNIHSAFFNSIISSMKSDKKRLLNYLLTYFIWNNDVFAINPEWFESLELTFRDLLKDRVNANVVNYSETKMSYAIKFSHFIDLKECSLVAVEI